MLFRIFFIGSLPFLIRFSSVSAQNVNVTCTSANMYWSYNWQGRSPCDVFAEVMALCSPSGWTLQPLPNGGAYYRPGLNTTPSEAFTYANDCTCNMVCYNLMAACSNCQSAATNWLNESQWRQGCPSYNTLGISVPGSAALNISTWTFWSAQGGAWNAEDAYKYLQGASSTPGGTTSTTASTTGGENTGAIAGGVIGGLVLLAALGAIAIFWRKRRRNLPNTSPASDTLVTTEMPTFDNEHPTATGGAHPSHMSQFSGTFPSDQDSRLSQFSGAAPASPPPSSPPGHVYWPRGWTSATTNIMGLAKYTGLPEAT